MPLITYQVKPESNGSCCLGTEPEKPYIPRVYLDTSVAMAKTLDVGQDVTVILKGKVVGVQLRDRETNPASFDLELSSISVKTPDAENDVQDIIDAEEMA